MPAAAMPSPTTVNPDMKRAPDDRYLSAGVVDHACVSSRRTAAPGRERPSCDGPARSLPTWAACCTHSAAPAPTSACYASPAARPPRSMPLARDWRPCAPGSCNLRLVSWASPGSRWPATPTADWVSSRQLNSPGGYAARSISRPRTCCWSPTRRPATQRHRRLRRRVRRRQAGGCASGGAYLAGCLRRLDDRSGCRCFYRPRHPESRRGRARKPVTGSAPADTPPRPAGRATIPALAGTATCEHASCRDRPAWHCSLGTRFRRVTVASPLGQAARRARSVAVAVRAGGGSAGISARDRGCGAPTGRNIASDAGSSSALMRRIMRITARAAVIAHPRRRRRRRSVGFLVIRGGLDDWPCVGAGASVRGWDARARAALPRSGSGQWSRWRWSSRTCSSRRGLLAKRSPQNEQVGVSVPGMSSSFRSQTSRRWCSADAAAMVVGW